MYNVPIEMQFLLLIYFLILEMALQETRTPSRWWKLKMVAP